MPHRTHADYVHPIGNGNGAFVKVAKLVGYVCGAIIAATTVVTMVVGYIQKPLMTMVQEERQARQLSDSLMIVKLEDISHDVSVIGSAMNAPMGAERKEVLEQIRDGAPSKR